MPIYEYQCTRCGKKFEAIQSIGEDSSKLNCPDCDASNPERLISSFFSSNASATGCSIAGSST